MTTEDVDATITTEDDVHAVTDITLVHQRLTSVELFALKLVDESRDQLLLAIGEERNL